VEQSRERMNRSVAVRHHALRGLRLAPNVYIAHTQPGFEGVAWSEIAARCAVLGREAASGGLTPQHAQPGHSIAVPPAIGGRHGDGVPRSSAAAAAQRRRGEFARVARELARRTVPDRAGMTIFSAPRPDALRLIRTAEDIFAMVGYRHSVKRGADMLDRVRQVAREAPYVDHALDAHVRITPGSHAGRRLNFRVVARMTGEQDFRRVDVERAVARGITERGDHRWRPSEDAADVEFWTTMLGDELIIALRLSDERMRHREYKVAHLPGSLRPSVAAALAWLSEPDGDDVVLDPMCGTGTVLIERAHLGRHRLLIGSDRDSEALAAAHANVGPRYKPIELHPWDATALPLDDSSVSKIITNLPWGIKHGSHGDNRRLYPRMFEEFKRIIRKGGLMVMLTAETGLMSELARRGVLRAEKILRVSILGAPASVYVCRAT